MAIPSRFSNPPASCACFALSKALYLLSSALFMAISFSYRPFSCAALQGRTLVIDFLDFVEQHLPRRLPQQLSRRVAKELLSHAVEKHNAALAVELENRLSSA